MQGCYSVLHQVNMRASPLGWRGEGESLALPWPQTSCFYPLPQANAVASLTEAICVRELNFRRRKR